MTTATRLDVLEGDDVILGEEGVRKLYATAFEDKDVSVAVQEQAEADFKAVVDEYIQLRGRLDPEWHSMPETDDEDADFDFYGDSVEIEWRETDRCGDDEYFRREFPISDLWHPDWEALIRDKVEERRAAREAKLAEATAKRKAEVEARERRTLLELLDKYGIPPEYQRRVGHG